MTIVKSAFSRHSSRLSSVFAASAVARPCSTPTLNSNTAPSSSPSYSSTSLFRRFASSMAACNVYDSILTTLSKPGGGEIGKDQIDCLTQNFIIEIRWI